MKSKLVSDLLSDPRAFREKGKTYELLQEFFAGLNVNLLRRLLHNDDLDVRNAAIWITSELGYKANSLINDVMTSIEIGDRYYKYHALEIIASYSHEESPRYFAQIPLALESDDDVLRRLAMRLLVRTDVSILQIVLNHHLLSSVHKVGIRLLLDAAEMTKETLRDFLVDQQKVLRLYASVAVFRVPKLDDSLIGMLLNSTVPDVSRFANEWTV
jgi:hypothetical protein